MLKGALNAGSVLAATSIIGPHGVKESQMLHSTDVRPDSSNEIAAILNLATTVEALTVTFYSGVLDAATFVMDHRDVDHLRQVMDAEIEHLEGWRALGGVPQTKQFHLPLRLLTDASTFVDTGLLLETTAMGLYLAATHQFATLGNPRLAAVAAQHAASEAQHRTILSRLAGLPPNHATLPSPLGQVSDAWPILKSFLEGEPNGRLHMNLPAFD